MTNGELLQRQQILQKASECVSTVRGRYALQKNLRKVEGALETYSEMLQELAQEHDVDLQGGLSPDAPEAFRDDLDELLQMDTDAPDVHTIGGEVLEAEDEKGSDIPMELLAALDFMIDE